MCAGVFQNRIFSLFFNLKHFCNFPSTFKLPALPQAKSRTNMKTGKKVNASVSRPVALVFQAKCLSEHREALLLGLGAEDRGSPVRVEAFVGRFTFMQCGP